ncbi:hypothetical protein ElyMa_003049600 [Elysia marginata]|uniref:SWIM-type domain-containing protein n=1 Tax=Elysia marginata TaxID=1093978 RepID=A0AAV4IJM5_9GAST|nr:hypothetical protein ElyMa_003049600 [Elysia marginata]
MCSHSCGVLARLEWNTTNNNNYKNNNWSSNRSSNTISFSSLGVTRLRHIPRGRRSRWGDGERRRDVFPFFVDADHSTRCCQFRTYTYTELLCAHVFPHPKVRMNAVRRCAKTSLFFFYFLRWIEAA